MTTLSMGTVLNDNMFGKELIEENNKNELNDLQETQDGLSESTKARGVYEDDRPEPLIPKEILDRMKQEEDAAGSPESAELNEQEAADRSRKNKVRGIITALVVVLILGCGAGYYIYRAQQFAGKYLPGTVINGRNVEGMTPDEYRELIRDDSDDYSITVMSRGREDEKLSGDDLGLSYVTDDAPDRILAGQNKYKWIEGRWKTTEYKIDTMLQLDEEAFAYAVYQLNCFDNGTSELPTDAKLSDYIPGVGYRVVKESSGNYLTEKEEAAGLIRGAVLRLEPDIDLDRADLDLYRKPRIFQDNRRLNETAAQLNRYALAKITYLYSDLVLDGSRIMDWVSLDDAYVLTLDDDGIEEFVDEVAKTYDTLYMPKKLVTSYEGKEVTIEGGSYGWQVDKQAEREAVREIIAGGQKITREPVFSRKAASHGEADYGNTYVEINITAQHLWYYIDGRLFLDSDFVSGKLTNDRRTPNGVYSLKYKQAGAVLRGPGYESPVSYWMPFNEGIGLHDATWRNTFGGQLYKNNGSHGCINLPLAVAKIIFNNIEPGCPILCYTLEGTETEETTVGAKGCPQLQESIAAEKKETTAAKTQTRKETTAAQTQPAASQPAETQPAETQPAETTAAQPGTPGGPGRYTPIIPETSPAQTQPAETRPAETQPSQAGPGVKPGETEPTKVPVTGVHGGPGV